MLYRKLVVRPYDGLLEQRECRFHGVRVDFALHVFARAVPDLGVLHIAETGEAEVVPRRIVGHDPVGLRVNVLHNLIVECLVLHAGHGHAARWLG